MAEQASGVSAAGYDRLRRDYADATEQFVGRILVVEDNALNLKLVRDVLQVAGYEVIEATTGEQGIVLAIEGRPDLILMDLQLPGIDGSEALRTIRSDPRTSAIPIVAVSAFAMKADRERAYRDGFDGYLEKPISVRALPDQVSGFLKARPDE